MRNAPTNRARTANSVSPLWIALTNDAKPPLNEAASSSRPGAGVEWASSHLALLTPDASTTSIPLKVCGAFAYRRTVVMPEYTTLSCQDAGAPTSDSTPTTVSACLVSPTVRTARWPVRRWYVVAVLRGSAISSRPSTGRRPATTVNAATFGALRSRPTSAMPSLKSGPSRTALVYSPALIVFTPGIEDTRASSEVGRRDDAPPTGPPTTDALPTASAICRLNEALTAELVMRTPKSTATPSTIPKAVSAERPF